MTGGSSRLKDPVRVSHINNCVIPSKKGTTNEAKYYLKLLTKAEGRTVFSCFWRRYKGPLPSCPSCVFIQEDRGKQPGMLPPQYECLTTLEMQPGPCPSMCLVTSPARHRKLHAPPPQGRASEHPLQLLLPTSCTAGVECLQKPVWSLQPGRALQLFVPERTVQLMYVW